MGITGDESGTRDLITTQPYTTFPVVAVMAQAAPAIVSVADLRGLPLIIWKGAPEGVKSLAHELSDRVTVAETADEGLGQVATGRAAAYLGNLAVVDGLINERYPSELKVAASTGIRQPLVFGIRPRYARLVGLLDRALQAMPVAERSRIRTAWIGPTDRYADDLTTTLRKVAPYVAGLAVIIIILGSVNRRLRAEVQRRQVAEAKLNLQLSFQQTLLDTVPFPIVAVDVDGRYRALNQSFERAYNVQADELLDRATTGPSAVVLPMPFSAPSPEIVHVRIDAEEREGAPGTDTSYLYWQRAVTDPEGNIDLVLATAVDVTPIRRAERQAREAREQLTKVTQRLPGVVFELRRFADGRLLFPFIAGDTQSLFGLTPQQMMADERLAFSRIDPRDQMHLAEAVERAAQKRSEFATEFRVEHGGRTRWIGSHAAIYEADASVTGWSGYWVDITMQHEQAEALRIAQRESQAAADAKATFLATMRHEIRTPMNGVIGMLEVLALTGLTNEQRHMIEIIDESTRALGQILDDVLDYSKMDAGQMQLDVVESDIRLLVDNVLSTLASLPAAKSVALRSRISAEVPILLRIDPTRFRQILANLVTNASKFTIQGEIVVRLDVVSRGKGELLRLRVQDTGKGISPEALSRLFAPFSQADSTVVRHYGGTGLGLAISRRLAEMMGGRLWLESEEEVGTIAFFEMPALAGEGAPLAELEGRRVAVSVRSVEDLANLRERLVALGASIVDVDSAPIPDLIITDHLIPDLHVDTSCAYITHNHLPLGLVNDGTKSSLSMSPLRGSALVTVAQARPDPFSTSETVTNAPFPAAAKSDLRVLVAEDHPINRTLIERQLRLLGIEPTIVVDGESALEALQQASYDLLLTDCQMQPVDGYQLTRRWRDKERDATFRLPIVAMTATTTGDGSRPWIDAGMDDYLPKPVRIESLTKILTRWCGFEPPNTSKPNDDTPASENRFAHLLTTMGTHEAVDAFLLRVIEDAEGAIDRLYQDEICEFSRSLSQWIHHQIGLLRMVDAAPIVEALAELERMLLSPDPADHVRRFLGLLPELTIFVENIAIDRENLTRRTDAYGKS
jgi:signal transduction histidine kinase/CheY-like chemotaxis protein